MRIAALISRPTDERCPICPGQLRLGADGRLYCPACDYVECPCDRT